MANKKDEGGPLSDKELSNSSINLFKEMFERDNDFYEAINKHPNPKASKEQEAYFRNLEGKWVSATEKYVILGEEPKHLGDFPKMRAEALLDKIFDFMIEYKISGRYPCAMPSVTFDYSDKTDSKSFTGFNISLSRHQAASYRVPLMADLEEAAVYIKEYFSKKPKRCDICHRKQKTWSDVEKEIVSARDMRVPLNLKPSKTPLKNKK